MTKIFEKIAKINLHLYPHPNACLLCLLLLIDENY
jgi:hypothetical protein